VAVIKGTQNNESLVVDADTNSIQAGAGTDTAVFSRILPLSLSVHLSEVETVRIIVRSPLECL